MMKSTILLSLTQNKTSHGLGFKLNFKRVLDRRGYSLHSDHEHGLIEFDSLLRLSHRHPFCHQNKGYLIL